MWYLYGDVVYYDGDFYFYTNWYNPGICNSFNEKLQS